MSRGTVSMSTYEGVQADRARALTKLREAESERDRYKALAEERYRHGDDLQLAFELLDLLATLRQGGHPGKGQSIDPTGRPTHRNEPVDPASIGRRWRRVRQRMVSEIKDAMSVASQKIDGSWTPPSKPREWRWTCKHRGCNQYDQRRSSRQGPTQFCPSCGGPVVSTEANT